MTNAAAFALGIPLGGIALIIADLAIKHRHSRTTAARRNLNRQLDRTRLTVIDCDTDEPVDRSTHPTAIRPDEIRLPRRQPSIYDRGRPLPVYDLEP